MNVTDVLPGRLIYFMPTPEEIVDYARREQDRLGVRALAQGGVPPPQDVTLPHPIGTNSSGFVFARWVANDCEVDVLETRRIG